MVIRVNFLIYLYIILCICTLLFDFFYRAKKRWQRDRTLEITSEYRVELMQMMSGDADSLHPKRIKHLIKRLGRSTEMLAFHEAVMSYLTDPQFHEQMNSWLWQNRNIFFSLKERYVDKKDAMLPAFYAFIIWKHNLCGKDEKDRFVLLVQELCMRPSLYCRENALCALYACGEAGFVVKAYLLLAQHDITHSEKLVTDGLLQFSGDHDVLSNELWQNFDQFPPHYQVCFLNYIRMVSEKFGERCYHLLIKDQADREVQFAAIRYLRSYPYADAAAYLQRLVISGSSEDWEYAAIAALSLEKYPSEDTKRVLTVGCRANNWHVRENSSESLLTIMDAAAIQKIIEGETDKYAKEMLSYKSFKRWGGAENDGCY